MPLGRSKVYVAVESGQLILYYERTFMGSDASKKLADKRIALRDSFWPGAAGVVWSKSTAKGYGTIPRILPLVMRLMQDLSAKGDPSGVYLDLWARDFGEGIITVSNEEDFAYSSGYSGPRAARSWRERIEKLIQLGFIRTKEQGNRDVAHILLLDPYYVCAKLRADGKIPADIHASWWSAFVARAQEIKAVIPEIAPHPPVPVPEFAQ
jgi:hypothetical protein